MASVGLVNQYTNAIADKDEDLDLKKLLEVVSDCQF
jgi:hypothetical protein